MQTIFSFRNTHRIIFKFLKTPKNVLSVQKLAKVPITTSDDYLFWNTLTNTSPWNEGLIPFTVFKKKSSNDEPDLKRITFSLVFNIQLLIHAQTKYSLDCIQAQRYRFWTSLACNIVTDSWTFNHYYINILSTVLANKQNCWPRKRCNYNMCLHCTAATE